MSNIVFYFPYPRVGGVSVLFLRLAQKIQYFATTYVMDLPDGYMAKNLPPNCRFIPYDKPEMIPNDAIVIFQSVPLWRIKHINRFPCNAKVLFWNLHPYNLDPGLIQMGSRLLNFQLFKMLNGIFSIPRFYALKKLSIFLEERNSIVFMDEENRVKTCIKLNHKFYKKYLPIMTEDVPEDGATGRPEKVSRSLKIAWVGRLEGFKIPILLHTLQRLDKIHFFKIEIDIIGDGVESSLVREKAASLERLVVNFKGDVNYKDLDSALLCQHLIFAMGTSALDGARLRIPTFVLDYSYSQIKGNYKFRLLKNSTGFNVAEEITELHMEKISSLEVILKEVVDNYEREAQLTFDYWLANHSPNTVSSKFFELAGEAAAKFDDLNDKGFFKVDILTKIICLVDHRKGDGSGFILR
jgi:hypothetical protein